jgi:hypothetical protein
MMHESKPVLFVIGRGGPVAYEAPARRVRRGPVWRPHRRPACPGPRRRHRACVCQTKLCGQPLGPLAVARRRPPSERGVTVSWVVTALRSAIRSRNACGPRALPVWPPRTVASKTRSGRSQLCRRARMSHSPVCAKPEWIESSPPAGYLQRGSYCADRIAKIALHRSHCTDRIEGARPLHDYATLLPDAAP